MWLATVCRVSRLAMTVLLTAKLFDSTARDSLRPVFGCCVAKGFEDKVLLRWKLMNASRLRIIEWSWQEKEVRVVAMHLGREDWVKREKKTMKKRGTKAKKEGPGTLP